MKFKMDLKKRVHPNLVTTLVIMFMGMIFFILAVSSIFAYSRILNIMKNQMEQTTLSHFNQSEYNINMLLEETERISTLISRNMYLQNFYNKRQTNELKDIAMINGIYERLTQILSNYEYIESIYCYGENGIILVSTQEGNFFSNDQKKENWFYTSGAYNKINDKDSSTFWFGGYSAKDFRINSMVESENKRYITFARKLNFLNSRLATLVINVNEQYFTSIYNNSSRGIYNNMYVIDDKGIVISNKDSRGIGQKCSGFYDMDRGKSNGSFTSGKEQDGKQVIYHSLEDTGWTMVTEIPMGVYAKDILALRKIFIVLFVFGIILAYPLSRYWVYRIMKPLNQLTHLMGEMEKGKLGLMLPDLPKNELGLLGKQFNKMSASISELIRQNEMIQVEKRKREIYALQAQINPHFLYNTLNTIKWMALMVNAPNIVDSITTLGNIIQPIFKNSSISCSIREEISFLENYIKIMNVRYGECIKTNFSVPGNLLEFKILRFILQPLFENSITHGINKQNGNLVINLETREEDNDILFTVSDSGKSMTAEKLEEIGALLESSYKTEEPYAYGIGLVNVNRRLKLHFGEKYGIRLILGEEGGMVVCLKIPKSEKDL